MVFSQMGIETKEVIKAMNTKWNALGFYPGLVGGHCIGIDPYYFVYQPKLWAIIPRLFPPDAASTMACQVLWCARS